MVRHVCRHEGVFGACNLCDEEGRKIARAAYYETLNELADEARIQAGVEKPKMTHLSDKEDRERAQLAYVYDETHMYHAGMIESLGTMTHLADPNDPANHNSQAEYEAYCRRSSVEALARARAIEAEMRANQAAYRESMKKTRRPMWLVWALLSLDICNIYFERDHLVVSIVWNSILFVVFWWVIPYIVRAIDWFPTVARLKAQNKHLLAQNEKLLKDVGQKAEYR